MAHRQSKGAPARPSSASTVSPVVGRVIKAVQQLRLDSEKQLALEEESSAKVQQLSVQVSALQQAFMTLADAVVEELDGLRQESVRLAREQEQLSQSNAQLRSQLAAAGARRTEAASSGAGPVGGPAHSAADASISGLQAGLHELAVQVDGVRAESGEAARAAQSAERRVGELYPQFQQLRGQVALDTASIRMECAQAAGALARDVEGLNGDVQGLQLWSKQTESDHAERLAALEESGEVEALAQRLQAVTAAHARHAKGVEEVMRSLLSDTAAVAKAARTHDARIEGLSRAIEMQHEALTKSCSVFAEALHVPSPLSAAASASLASFLDTV